MKIICSKSNLLDGVNIVLKAVSTKSTLPILECILMEVNDNTIKLTANDMELGIETIVEGEIIDKGKIAIEAKLLSEIIRKLPNSDVTMETNDSNQVLINCEKANFNIPIRTGDDFPSLPTIERDNYITLSQFSLKEIIHQTIFSISDNENNKLMTGELFEINEDTLRVVSLDGHRISMRKINLKEAYEPTKVIVPGKTLNDISKILSGESDKNVKIYFTNKHILFEFNSTTVVSRLLEGEYYKIDQMLSKDYETKINVKKKEFLECIDRASLLIKESDKKPIIINVENNSMELKIKTPIGSMNEDMEVAKEGKDILIGFNPKFLMDALRVLDDENIDIYMVNSKAPCIIRNEEDSYIYLILPVNFNVAAI